MTERETDVLRAAQTGISTEQIAARLALAPATVRNYLSNAITKVGGGIASTPSASPPMPVGYDTPSLRARPRPGRLDQTVHGACSVSWSRSKATSTARRPNGIPAARSICSAQFRSSSKAAASGLS